MNLNCAILHADPEITEKLGEYIAKVPFLSLRGKYSNPLDALRDYYESKVEVYFMQKSVGLMTITTMITPSPAMPPLLL